jgi:hypothetical protein
MKKILIGLFCYSCFLFSCDDKKTPTTLKTGDSSEARRDNIPVLGRRVNKDSAENMIKYFNTRKQHLNFNGIVWAAFDTTAMRGLYSDPTIVRVVFFIGVSYGAGPGKNDDVPVILLQVQRRDKETLNPLPLEYYEGNTLCPPPDNVPCGTPAEPSNS